ncbi:MAG: pyrroline-5-carboxylate reductase [Firmicutes bacterium]|jgi:pyrroline-5-carboxylate reductase|nr:pyrroline-5-carboxylate reductase [Bacillota bacterium]
MERIKIGFIGCGVMGSAIVNGVLKSGLFAEQNVWINDRDTAKTASLGKNFAVNITDNVSELCQKSDVIIISIKPDGFDSLLREIEPFLGEDRIIVSVAAGVSTASIERILGNRRVVRVMPNTPCLVGEGVMALAAGKYARPADLDMMEKIFKPLGMTVRIPEKNMNAVTALSGSGPAYVFLFIEALADGGVNLGLDRHLSTRLALQTILGSAQMAQKTDTGVVDLKNMVASPGGTTMAALKVFEENAFKGTVINALARAAARAGDLEE